LQAELELLIEVGLDDGDLLLDVLLRAQPCRVLVELEGKVNQRPADQCAHCQKGQQQTQKDRHRLHHQTRAPAMADRFIDAGNLIGTRRLTS
jgi:hypothetical protein